MFSFQANFPIVIKNPPAITCTVATMSHFLWDLFRAIITRPDAFFSAKESGQKGVPMEQQYGQGLTTPTTAYHHMLQNNSKLNGVLGAANISPTFPPLFNGRSTSEQKLKTTRTKSLFQYQCPQIYGCHPLYKQILPLAYGRCGEQQHRHYGT